MTPTKDLLEQPLHAAEFLDLPATPDEVAAIACGPLTRRYSKAPEYEYGPELRRELLAEAGKIHAREIDAAVDMLNEAAKTSPLLYRALSRTAPEF